MDAALDGLFRVSDRLWMGWNLLLAVVPLCLAVGLFRRAPEARRGFWWWIGVIAFLAFLPNAPYLITDVVHLLADVRASRTDLEVMLVLIPFYGAFIALGVAAYAVSLDWLGTYLRHTGWSRTRRWALEAALHLLAAVGIYLGRVARLNSWDLFLRPRSVLATLPDLLRFNAVGVIALTVLTVAAAVWFMRTLAAGLSTRLSAFDNFAMDEGSQ